MRSSSGYFEIWPGRAFGLEDGPEDVHAAAGEGDDGLVVTFPLAPFAVVEGAAVVVG